MPAGRPKKTLQQRVKDGTYDFKKHGPLPPELAGEAPPPPPLPADLDGESASLWAEVLETRRGGVRKSDGPALKMMCVWWAVFHATRAEVAEAPANLKTQALTRLGIATDKLTALMRLFGMTPQDRSKVAAEAAAGPAKAKVETRKPTRLDRAGKPK